MTTYQTRSKYTSNLVGISARRNKHQKRKIPSDLSSGIFITFNNINFSLARQEALATDTIKIGATDYPRLVLWSIEDLFEDQMPNIPVLADPYTGWPAQGLMFGDQ